MRKKVPEVPLGQLSALHMMVLEHLPDGLHEHASKAINRILIQCRKMESQLELAEDILIESWSERTLTFSGYEKLRTYMEEFHDE